MVDAWMNLAQLMILNVPLLRFVAISKLQKGSTFGSSKQYVFSGDEPLTYLKWCAWLVPMVLRSRTSFSAFVAKSISLPRGHRSGGPSPTFYPIPVPYMDIFVGMPSLSSAKRHTRLLRRAVHVMCMALNFWYLGGAFPEDVLLRREPSKQHRFLFAKICSYVRSDGLASGVPIRKSGRRVPELLACLSGLSALLTQLGASSDPYAKTFAGYGVEKIQSDEDVLAPFRDLDPSRLAVHGRGAWDITDYLSDYLAAVNAGS